MILKLKESNEIRFNKNDVPADLYDAVSIISDSTPTSLNWGMTFTGKVNIGRNNAPLFNFIGTWDDENWKVSDILRYGKSLRKAERTMTNLSKFEDAIETLEYYNDLYNNSKLF